MTETTTSRALIIQHDGIDYTGQMSRIHSTRLTGAGAAIVGEFRGQHLALELTPADEGDLLATLAAAIQVAGVETWEQLPGATLVILFTVEDGTATARGIAHAIDDAVLVTNPAPKPKTRTRSPRKPADHQEPAAAPAPKRTRTKAKP